MYHLFRMVEMFTDIFEFVVTGMFLWTLLTISRFVNNCNLYFKFINLIFNCPVIPSQFLAQCWQYNQNWLACTPFGFIFYEKPIRFRTNSFIFLVFYLLPVITQVGHCGFGSFRMGICDILVAGGHFHCVWNWWNDNIRIRFIQWHLLPMRMVWISH